MNKIPFGKYKSFIKLMPIACVDVCIKWENKVLMVLRKDPPAANHWWIPGGRIYKGETIGDAALRKAKEEVGLSCQFHEIIHTEETMFEKSMIKSNIHTVNIVCLLFPISGKIVLDESILKFAWIDMINNSFHPYIKRSLLKAGLCYEI